jgi:peptidoglycan/LPS O-acetylase OafA/YrhL
LQAHTRAWEEESFLVRISDHDTAHEGIDRTSTIGLRRFYVRRAYRILPAAILFMVPVFAIFWHELRWYHMAAAALYLVNYDFSHPWFLGHFVVAQRAGAGLLFVAGRTEEVASAQSVDRGGAIAVAPLFRVACHFLGLHGRADETFPAVADILAIGCLLAFFSKRMPKIKAWATLMVLPVVLVPFYIGLRRFHLTVIVLFVL